MAREVGLGGSETFLRLELKSEIWSGVAIIGGKGVAYTFFHWPLRVFGGFHLKFFSTQCFPSEPREIKDCLHPDLFSYTCLCFMDAISRSNRVSHSLA